MVPLTFTANFIKAGLNLTPIRGLHRITYGLSQQPSYSVLQWLNAQSRTLCLFHSQLVGAAATRQRHYSSVAVPHGTQGGNDNNHNQRNCRELPTSHSGDDLFVPDRTIGLTKAEQKKLLRKPPEQLEKSRILKVAIIGAPNAGKSTLANMLMGWRFASVSKKVHTTRHRAIGVLTEGDTQIVFLDTPGMITPGKRMRHRLEMSLLTDPHSVLYDADLIAVIVDVSNIWHRTKIEEEVLKALHLHRAKPAILVLNKIDRLKRKEELLNITRTLTEGIVGGQKNWSTVKPTKKKIDIESLFEKMDSDKANRKLRETQSDSKYSSNQDSLDIDGQGDLDLSKSHKDVFDRIMSSDERGLAETSLESLEMENATEKTDEGGSEVISQQPFVGEISGDDGTTIEIHGTSEEELNKFLAGDNVSVDDDGGDVNDRGVAKTQWSETAARGQHRPDLRDGEVWRKYYRRIQEAQREVGEKRGWGNFDAVFMLSALEGDGVIDLKNYLLESAVSGPWQFHSSLVTDQNPIEIARMCVWEKMLDHLPEEIPYQIKIRLALWEIDEDNMLRATFELLCDTKRHMFAALGKGGQTAKLIAIEAKQDLMNTFRRDLSLRLVVRCKLAMK